MYTIVMDINGRNMTCKNPLCGFVGSRIVPAASFVLENSIRKQTTGENKWLSQFGSRLINRSQFPHFCVHFTCLFPCVRIHLHTVVMANVLYFSKLSIKPNVLFCSLFCRTRRGKHQGVEVYLSIRVEIF